MRHASNILLSLLLSFTAILSVYCYAEQHAAETTITPIKTTAKVNQYSPALVLYDTQTNKHAQIIYRN